MSGLGTARAREKSQRARNMSESEKLLAILEALRVEFERKHSDLYVRVAFDVDPWRGGWKGKRLGMAMASFLERLVQRLVEQGVEVFPGEDALLRQVLAQGGEHLGDSVRGRVDIDRPIGE